MHIYHYTAGHHLSEIAASGALLPTGEMIAPRERRVLWFSLHPHWEPTAIKMFLWAGSTTPVKPSFEVMAAEIGAYRFALPARDKRLLPWRRLSLVAHIPPAEAARMVEVGIRAGARPHDWYGVLDPIPLTDLTFEAWSGSAWVPGTLAEGIANSPAERRRIGRARFERAA